MRKSLLIIPVLLSSIGIEAANNVEPIFIPTMYAVKISPNGEWIGSMSGNASLYNTNTNEMVYYNDCYLGLGNTIADSGVAVGDCGGYGVFMYNGEIIYPVALEDYFYSNINAITPDGSRVVGTVNDVTIPDLNYVPFVADVTPDFELENLEYLPIPPLDFFGSVPQFVTVQYISYDGKTAAGQVVDWKGSFTYPIVYQQQDNGEWTYNLPSESLFNPTGINIPPNPWSNEPEFPDPTDYMSPLRLQAYELAYQAYLNGEGEEPIPENYMTDEQFAQYKEAVETYNEWYYGFEERMNEYNYIYWEIFTTSPTMADNEMALDPSGKYVMCCGGTVNNKAEFEGKIYKFSCDGYFMRTYDTPNPALYPSQILRDGTLVATLPMIEIPTTYLMLPGSEDFITIPEFLQPDYPELTEWMNDFIPGGSGLVCLSDDFSVLSGGLLPAQLAYYDEDEFDFYYSTYILAGMESSLGVETIPGPDESGVYRVYNIQGLKVMETKESSDINTLPKGIYIINGKKNLVR